MDDLSLVEDSFALIWLRLSPCPDICCVVAYESLINALYYDGVGIRSFCCDSFRIRELDRMRVSEFEDECVALLCCGISYTYDVELLLKSVCNSLNHVSDE